MLSCIFFHVSNEIGKTNETIQNITTSQWYTRKQHKENTHGMRRRDRVYANRYTHKENMRNNKHAQQYRVRSHEQSG